MPPDGLPPAAPTATLRNARGRTLLAGFTAAHFSHHISNGLLNPLLPVIRDSFALDYTQSGLLVSAFFVSQGFSNPPIGVLADRIGPRPVIAGGLLLTGAISAALAFAGAYWQLLVLLLLMGVIAGTYHAPAAASLSRAFPANVRGAAIGLHITGGHLSFFVTPLLAAAFVSATGTWRTPYLWLAFAPLVTGLLIWYLAPKAHERRLGRGSWLATLRDLRLVVRTIGPLVSLSLLFQMTWAALLAFLTLYLVDARNLPLELAAFFLGLPQLLGLLGAPLAGALSDRLGRRTLILAGIVLLGPSVLAFTLVPDEWVVVPLVVIGLATPLRQTVTEVLVLESAPADRRATFLGSYYLLSQELGGVAAPLFGLAASIVGIGAAFSGTSVALACVSAAVLLLARRL